MRFLLLLGTLLVLSGCVTDSAAPTSSSTAVAARPPKFHKDLSIQDTPWGRLRVIENLRAIKMTAPHYPIDLRRMGVIGSVTLDILIDETGKPVQLVVLKSSGQPAFDQSASACFAGWQYPIWLEDGKPSKVVTRQLISFSLNN